MSTRDRIDTLEGITAMLATGGHDSLVGLHLLIQERIRWRKEHPEEKLNQWYVLGGRVCLDEFGQSHMARFEPELHWVQPTEPRPGLTTIWSSQPIPRPIDRCMHCDGEITARQLGSLYVGNYDQNKDRLVIFHEECRFYWIDEQHREGFRVAFQEGLNETPAMTPIPSGYHETKIYGPWYKVESAKLGPITLGWRKRVVHLDWSASKALADVDGNALFASESVTTGEHYVHAWGYGKLRQYLRMLWEESSR